MSAEQIRQGLRALAATARASEGLADRVAEVAERYLAVLRGGGTLLFAGNGGSAADAQHLATEYMVRFRRPRPALRALALTTDSSLLTAAGNDLGFDQVFARQVEALAGPGDLLVLHSTSGVSPNLLRAAEAGRRRGVPVVAFLGRDGGPLRTLADLAVMVPSEDPSRIQEVQLALQHLIVDVVEEALRR